MKKLKIAAVKYLNTLPMLAGLERSDVGREVEVLQVDPASCARLLLEGEVDAALCPVGALVDLDDYQIASGYGIGCDGPVRTVAVYADHPFAELEAIELYSESRSSNLLVQVLDNYHWKRGFDFKSPGDSKSSATGYLAIGDACFRREVEYEYSTDLGAAWKNFSGLPFLFAAWVSLKPVDSELWKRIDAAFADGIAHLDRIELPSGHAHVELRHYLQENIKYRITEQMLEGARTFARLARELKTQAIDAN